MPSPSRTLTTSNVEVPSPRAYMSGRAKFSPERWVEVSSPVRSSRLESAKTLSTSTCAESKAARGPAGSGTLFSPGSRRAGCTYGSKPTRSPSIVNGPSSVLSRCGCLANVEAPAGPAGVKNGSARIVRPTVSNQLLGSKRTTAAARVTVSTAGVSAASGRRSSVKVMTLKRPGSVPVIEAIL